MIFNSDFDINLLNYGDKYHYSNKAKRLFGLQQLYKKAHYRVLASKNAPVFLKDMLQGLNHRLNSLRSTAYWKLDGLNRKAKGGFPGIEEGTEEAEAYLTATYSALNFAYANRSYFAALIRDALGKRETEAAAKAADMIALNAGAALYVSGVVATLKQGVALAEDVIYGGQALEKMEALAVFSQGLASV